MTLSPSEHQYQLKHINDDRSSGIVISHAVVLPLAYIAVVARFVSRRLCKARIEIDDYTIVAALVGGFRNTFCSGKVADDLIQS